MRERERGREKEEGGREGGRGRERGREKQRGREGWKEIEIVNPNSLEFLIFSRV